MPIFLGEQGNRYPLGGPSDQIILGILVPRRASHMQENSLGLLPWPKGSVENDRTYWPQVNSTIPKSGSYLAAWNCSRLETLTLSIVTYGENNRCGSLTKLDQVTIRIFSISRKPFWWRVTFYRVAASTTNESNRNWGSNRETEPNRSSNKP